MRESQSKNEAHARLLSEQYEHCEAHVHDVVASDGGTTEASVQYEVPLKLQQSVLKMKIVYI